MRQEMGKKVECLGDLQGPKFRVGELAGDPVELKNGEIFEFGTLDEVSSSLGGREISIVCRLMLSGHCFRSQLEPMSCSPCSEASARTTTI